VIEVLFPVVPAPAGKHPTTAMKIPLRMAKRTAIVEPADIDFSVQGECLEGYGRIRGHFTVETAGRRSMGVRLR
jgi:hypothetical protein